MLLNCIMGDVGSRETELFEQLKVLISWPPLHLEPPGFVLLSVRKSLKLNAKTETLWLLYDGCIRRL